MSVLKIYALYKNDEVLQRGSLKSVWGYTVNNLGHLDVNEFKQQGYSIEPMTITATERKRA